MIKSLIPSVFLAASLGILAPISQAQAAILVFTANLSGANETPPNNSSGTGTALVKLDDVANTLQVQVSFSGLTGTTTNAHIHSATTVPGMGVAGVATPVPSFPGFPSGISSGTYDNLFDMTLASSYNPTFITNNGGTVSTAQAALFAGIQEGKAYFNLHSSAFPGGEISGFFVAVPESSSLLGLLTLGTIGLIVSLKRS